MITKSISVIVVAILICATAVTAETDLFRRFKDAYNRMGSDLATAPPAELAEVKDFVYQKDVATFTLKEGRIYLLREIEGRPTTAMFIGQGHCSIEVPSHVERKCLTYSSRYDRVDEEFEIAFFNFSDNFDLKLKEQFTFEATSLPWRDFNKDPQGEFFFTPVLMHQYDNYFQLLRSHFERADDGYFWVDFNRYIYSYDPNRPEEVVVAYENEGGDIEATAGAVMQRQTNQVYDDNGMSAIPYPTTLLDRRGDIHLTGLKGMRVNRGSVEFDLLVNTDSLRFLSLFLHFNLRLDSLFYNDQPVEHWRRSSFTFIGVILPEYRHQGDTVTLRAVYRGDEYFSMLPFVENPSPCMNEFNFQGYPGYNYIMPGMSAVEKTDEGIEFSAVPPDPYRIFMFLPLATGYDTVSVVSDIGLSLSLLKSGHIDKHHYDCFIPDRDYDEKVMAAFNYLSGRLGPPLSTFSVAVYPQPFASMPGFVGISQTDCHKDGTGGLTMAAGQAFAQQWFGALMRPQSDREFWLTDALPDYLGLLTTTHDRSWDIFFGELGRRRNFMYTILDNRDDQPLACGRRIDPLHRKAKGSWVLHMLRCMMLEDPSTASDAKFWQFINELKIMTSTQLFTNEDVIKLAEKHHGQPLDWFFKHWLYDRNIPSYRVDYKIEKRADGQYITAEVKTEDVADDFKMPVIMSITPRDKKLAPVFDRVMIEGPHDTFELGPFDFEPRRLVFNELRSVLSRDKVKKR